MRGGIVWAVLVVAACSSDPSGETRVDSGAGASGLGGDAGVGGSAGQAGTGGSGIGGTLNCTPGFVIYCDCPDGGTGTQTCIDGWGWGPCMCPDGGAGDGGIDAGDAASDGGVDAETDSPADALPDVTPDATVVGDTCDPPPAGSLSTWSKDCSSTKYPCSTCWYRELDVATLKNDQPSACGQDGRDGVVAIIPEPALKWTFYAEALTVPTVTTMGTHHGPVCSLPAKSCSGGIATIGSCDFAPGGACAGMAPYYLVADLVFFSEPTGKIRFYACLTP